MKKGSSRTIGKTKIPAAARAVSAYCLGPAKANTGERISDLFNLFASHQTAGPDRQDEQNRQERDPLFNVGVYDAEDLFEKTDHKTADQDPDGILEASENCRRERFDAW